MKIRPISLFCILLNIIFWLKATAQPDYGPVPTQSQLDWYDMERYAFIHFSINTFTDQEWGDGSESPELFNPTDLDCRQWARVCRDAGLKGIIITAKHHAGFCLWPSKYTEYSVKNSPWKNGKGDVLHELREACDEYGLKLGVYLSPWDRNRDDYGSPSYVEYFRNQLTELLTEYGDIFEVWFDGANGGWGYYGGAREDRNIDRSTYYDWPTTISLIRELQPECIIWNEVGPDIRWCGNEQGSIGETNWSRYDYAGHVPGQPDNMTLREGEPSAPDFVPAEVNVSIRPGWFYHEYEDLMVKNLPKLIDIYYNSVGRNATWLLNFPIDKRGRIHANDAKAALRLNKELKKIFKKNLAKDASCSFSDGTLNVALPRTTTFNIIMIEEPLEHGQRVKAFEVEAMHNGTWRQIASGTTIGNKRILRTGEVRTDSLRVVMHSDAQEVLQPVVSLFKAKDVPMPVDKEKYSMDRSKWRIVYPEKGDPGKMIDGDKSTMAWIDVPFPAEVVIDLGEALRIKGFRYLPDQSDYFLKGIVTNYEFAISADGENWEKVADGEFSNIAHNPLWQVVKFKTPHDARFIKFSGTKNTQGWGGMCCSEFDIIL